MLKTIKEFLNFKKHEKMVNSKKPYFSLNSLNMEDEDFKDGFKVEMDWNKAFIDELRAAGYEGITEEKIIEAYLYNIFAVARSKSWLDQDLLAQDYSEEV